MKTRGIEYLKLICRIWTLTRLNLAALEIKKGSCKHEDELTIHEKKFKIR